MNLTRPPATRAGGPAPMGLLNASRGQRCLASASAARPSTRGHRRGAAHSSASSRPLAAAARSALRASPLLPPRQQRQQQQRQHQHQQRDGRRRSVVAASGAEASSLVPLGCVRPAWRGRAGTGPPSRIPASGPHRRRPRSGRLSRRGPGPTPAPLAFACRERRKRRRMDFLTFLASTVAVVPVCKYLKARPRGGGPARRRRGRRPWPANPA
jgi:hypothetical protein